VFPILCERLHRLSEGSFAVGWLLGLEMNKGSRIFHLSMKSCRSLNDGFGAVLDDFEALVDRACFPAVRRMVDTVWRDLSNVFPHVVVKLNEEDYVWCLDREAMSRKKCSRASLGSGWCVAAFNTVSVV